MPDECFQSGAPRGGLNCWINGKKRPMFEAQDAIFDRQWTFYKKPLFYLDLKHCLKRTVHYIKISAAGGAAVGIDAAAKMIQFAGKRCATLNCIFHVMATEKRHLLNND